ncbi:MAG TPA: hypothetical protein VNE62_09360 [Actinomycetota bacterium]|nr:hypothetical protein [Actinomycetota bacterium]
MRHVLNEIARRVGTLAALSGLVAGLLVASSPPALSDHGGTAANPLNVEKDCGDPDDEGFGSGTYFGCAITLTNTQRGTDQAETPINNVTLTDEMEPNNAVRVFDVIPFRPDTTCTITDRESATDTPDVTCQIPALGVGPGDFVETISIIFQARPDACGGERTRDVTNTATASGTHTVSGPTTDDDSEVITIVCEADLELEKDCENVTSNRGTGPDGRIRVAPGDRIRCTLNLYNNGPGAALNVVLTDNLPETARIDPSSVRTESQSESENEAFACAVQEDPEGELRCEDPEMLYQEFHSVTYEAVVGTEGVGPGRRFNNQAAVTSDTFDPDDTDNDDQENFETPPCDGNLDARGAARGVSITGTRRTDVICGSRFGDSINALGGNDIVYGFGGNDAINGGHGNDVISGGSGNDAIRGHTGFDRIDGGTGRDACSGESKVRC